MPELRRLSLWRNPGADAGMKSFKGLTKLYFLDARKTKVTGKGLKELDGLKNLRELWGEKEVAASEEAAALKKALSKLRLES